MLLFGWSFLEGIGAALIMPAIVALVASNFGRAERPRAYGLVAAGGGDRGRGRAAHRRPLHHLLVVALRVRRRGARSSLVILVLTRRIAADTPERKVRLDLVGTALSALGLGLIVFGILRSGTWGFVQPKPDAPEWLGPLAGDLADPRRRRGRCCALPRLGEPPAWLAGRRAAGRPGDPARSRLLRGGLTAFFFQYLLQAGLFFAVPLFLSVALGLSAIDTGRAPPAALDHAAARRGRASRRSSRTRRRAGSSSSASSRCSPASSCWSPRSTPGAGPEIVTWPMLLAGLGIGALASQLGASPSPRCPTSRAARSAACRTRSPTSASRSAPRSPGAVLISALTASFFTGIEDNPAVPDDLTSKARPSSPAASRSSPTPISKTALDDAGVPPRATRRDRRRERPRRLDGLRAALAVLAVLALVALFFTRRIPTTQPAAAPQSAVT